MESIADNISVLGRISIGALILVGLLLLGIIFLWWEKNVFLYRLPRPFLGEGPNREWSEKKRVELEKGELSPGPRIYESSQAISWFPEGSETQAEPEPSSVGQDGSEDGHSAIEALISEDQQTPLRSWLMETGPIEHAWAEKLLGKRERSEKT